MRAAVEQRHLVCIVAPQIVERVREVLRIGQLATRQSTHRQATASPSPPFRPPEAAACSLRTRSARRWCLRHSPPSLRVRSRQSMQFVRITAVCRLRILPSLRSMLKNLLRSSVQCPLALLHRRFGHLHQLRDVFVVHVLALRVEIEPEIVQLRCVLVAISNAPPTPYYSLQAASNASPIISWSFFLSMRFTTITRPYF